MDALPKSENQPSLPGDTDGEVGVAPFPRKPLNGKATRQAFASIAAMAIDLLVEIMTRGKQACNCGQGYKHYSAHQPTCPKATPAAEDSDVIAAAKIVIPYAHGKPPQELKLTNDVDENDKPKELVVRLIRPADNVVVVVKQS